MNNDVVMTPGIFHFLVFVTVGVYTSGLASVQTAYGVRLEYDPGDVVVTSSNPSRNMHIHRATHILTHTTGEISATNNLLYSIKARQTSGNGVCRVVGIRGFVRRADVR